MTFALDPISCHSALSRVKTDSWSLQELTRPRCWSLAAFWLHHLPQREVGRQRPMRWYSSCVLKVLDSNTGGWMVLIKSRCSPKLECQIWNSFLHVESHLGVVSSGKESQQSLAEKCLPPNLLSTAPDGSHHVKLLVACSHWARNMCRGRDVWESGYTLNLPAGAERDVKS